MRYSQVSSDDLDFDIHDSPAAKRNRAKTAAERTKTWRAQRAEVGLPEVTRVDRAVVEATSFLMSIAPKSKTVSIDIIKLIEVTRIILVRDGFDRKLAKRAVIDRLRPRHHHDDCYTLPSRRPSATNALVYKPKTGSPHDVRDIDYIRGLVGQTPAG